MSALGKAISHESARGHVTGEALYTDDLVARQHAPLHAWPVQVQHAHARVKRLNAAPALDEPGVLTVLTQADVTGNGNTGPARQDEPLFPDVVEYYGQPLAWVLAESEEAARRGAARVTVEVEPLPATLEIDEGIAAQSFLSDAFYIRRGDSAAAMVAAPKRLAGEFHIGGQEHFYLETQAALAYRDESGEVFVQSSTQHPTETQAIVARVLGVQKHAVTVQCVRMGGGFGGKETQANTWAAVAALGAVKTGRPVRVRLNRTQDMTFTGKRHPFLVRYQVGFDERGKLLALDIELYSDGGYSLDLSEPVLYRAMFHCDNCYLIPALTVMGRVVKTHKCSNTAFRGFGGPQGMVAIEEIVDHVARSVGRPAHEVRAENFYSEGDETHYGQPVKDAGRIARIWESLREKSAFEARRAEVEAFNRAHVEKKRGLAITPVKFGISFTTAFFNQAGALVLIYQDGSVQVNHGGTEMGQGLYTKMLQVAAHALGVPIESVRMMPTRTDKVPNTSATAASSGSDLNGAAVKAACESLKERLAGVAAQHFGSDPADIIFDDGQV